MCDDRDLAANICVIGAFDEPADRPPAIAVPGGGQSYAKYQTRQQRRLITSADSLVSDHGQMPSTTLAWTGATSSLGRAEMARRDRVQ
jgi:hypothetical protein